MIGLIFKFLTLFLFLYIIFRFFKKNLLPNIKKDQQALELQLKNLKLDLQNSTDNLSIEQQSLFKIEQNNINLAQKIDLWKSNINIEPIDYNIYEIKLKKQIENYHQYQLKEIIISELKKELTTISKQYFEDNNKKLNYLKNSINRLK